MSKTVNTKKESIKKIDPIVEELPKEEVKEIVEEHKVPLTYLNIEPTISEFYMYPKSTPKSRRNATSPRFILTPRKSHGISIKVELVDDSAYATLKGFGDVVTTLINSTCSVTSKPKYEVIK